MILLGKNVNNKLLYEENVFHCFKKKPAISAKEDIPLIFITIYLF